MGMFDTLIDADGGNWQTKALSRALAHYPIGRTITGGGLLKAYQIAILGEPRSEADSRYTRAYATVRDGALASLPDTRDTRLPLLGYSGAWAEVGRPADPDPTTAKRLDDVERQLTELANAEHDVHRRYSDDYDGRDDALAALRLEALQLIAAAQSA